MKAKKKFRLWRKDIPWYRNFHIQPITINGYLFFFGLLFLVWAYQHDVAEYQELAENPCAYCELAYTCGEGGIGWDWENGTGLLPTNSERKVFPNLTVG